MRTILELVRPQPAAKWVAFYSPGEGADKGIYYDAHPSEHMSHHLTMLAYDMNDAFLLFGHGAPLRLRTKTTSSRRSRRSWPPRPPGTRGPPAGLACCAGAQGRVISVAAGARPLLPLSGAHRTTRAEGAVQVGLGETIRENRWGRDRK
jgi:hypothetical protein